LSQPIRLQGQQYDEESGLHYNRHRYYDPLRGRYITQDPIGLEGGWNLYQYPLDPIIGIDPLGLKSCAAKIADAAESLNFNRRYSYESAYGFDAKTNKCNLFVSDVLETAGLNSPKRYVWGIERGPITAGEWADKNKDVPGFEIVSEP
ncbi:RHS repeat domain-containing protein, partial [Serratia marcescens]|uniref:RHS repeat domain-containing protein n=1 Tax=Serratia marcescens TaxID=615 RepID=UPI0021CCDEA2